MHWIYNANNGRQLNKGMILGELACGHRVEVHPLDISRTRCFQCQSIQAIRHFFCGNCEQRLNASIQCMACLSLPKCRFGNGCGALANWCSAGFCKRHSSDAEIRKALEHPQLRQFLCADQIRTIFEFAERNPSK